MNNDTIDGDELFYNCNYQLLKDREIEAVKNNILEQHLPAHYHTEENIEYFKWKMEWLFKYSIIGMKNILRWQSQNDSWLDVVVDFLFHIKRNFKGITLTTNELQTLANFAAMVLNINGNSVSSFVNAFYKIFGNNVKIDIDTTNKTQILFLYDENLSENFIRALMENNLCPILVDYSFNILKLDNDSCFFTLRSLEDENLDSMQVDFDIYFTSVETIFNLKDNYQDLLKQFPLKHTCSFRDMRYVTTEEQDKIFKCWQWYPYHFMCVNI